MPETAAFVVHTEVRADERRPVFDRPVVVGRTADRVVALLDSEHAETLAKVIARWSTIRHELDIDLDGPTWDHTVIDLLSEAVLLRDSGVPVPTVVPLTVVNG